MANTWHFSKIWNEALDLNPQRPYVKRDHIWASELGGSYYDRYFKMKGRKPTTPPNLRSRRKFEGGNLTEWIVRQILARAGILKSTQKYITYEKGALRVTGKADFTAGGEIKDLQDLRDLPDTFQVMAQQMVEELKKKYPGGLKRVNIEIKSCSGQIFERYMRDPSPQHALQAFHYAFNTKRPTMLVYVSRDDFRIVAWTILPSSEKWHYLYIEDIETMEKVLALSTKEVKKLFKERLLVWDGEKFSKNWKIEYSNWLTDYGFEQPEDYAKPAQSMALRLTNIVKKIKENKPIDGKVNQKTLEECYTFYPEAEAIINELKEQYGTNNKPSTS